MPAQMNFSPGHVQEASRPLADALRNAGQFAQQVQQNQLLRDKQVQDAIQQQEQNRRANEGLLLQQQAGQRAEDAIAKDSRTNKALLEYSAGLSRPGEQEVNEQLGQQIGAQYQADIARGVNPEIAQANVQKALLGNVAMPTGDIDSKPLLATQANALATLEANKNRIQDVDFKLQDAKDRAEESRRNAAHRSAVLGLQRQEYNDRKGLLQGEVMGGLLPVEESTMQDVTKTVPTENQGAILQSAYDDMTKNIGSMDRKEQGKGYEEYLKANDPAAYEKYTERKSLAEKAYDQSKENTMRIPAMTLAGVQWAKDSLMPKSQADIDNAIDVPVKKGVMTRAEWLADNAKYDTQAKDAVKGILQTDKGVQKELGAIEDVVTKSAVRVDENTIKKNMYDTIQTYAQENKLPMDSPKILGMMKTASTKVDKILTNRADADKMQIKHAYDAMDTQAKQAFDLQLIQMKDNLGRVPTPKEEVDMKLQALKSQELKQKIDDAKGWW